MIIANPKIILVNRVRHGLTKEQLAVRIGVATSSVSRAENRKGISARTAKAICDYFKIDPTELLEVGGGANGEDAHTV
jgi:transcriptional regulator with XRE-family HTH domain